MLQQVVLNTAAPMTLNVEAVNPDDLVVIKSISGLDPADVNLFTGDFSRDGGYYQGRRAVGRNPVLNLKLNPDYSTDTEVSDIREMLYSIFYEPSATSDGLQVILKDDRKPDRYFIGYTEKMPAPIFESEPTAQVSMLCVDPYLKSVAAVAGNDAVGWTSLPVTYEGSARTGLEVNMKVKTATTVLNLEINGVLLTLNKSFAVNDIVIVNTLIGSRKITVNGVDAMATLAPTSKWVQLNKGVNTIKTYGSVSGDAKVAMMSYTYRAAWWGI